ncbi:transcriptional regulator CynR [soil metagenome]
MELRHLRYFLALSERLNFTQAAAQVHVTQSTLSHQIRQLEDELGQALFRRSERKVTMTAAGELFLPQAIKALRELDDGIALLSSAGQPLTGKLRIGTTPTFGIQVVPICAARLIAQHPSVLVSVQDDTSEGIAERVRAGEFDIAIGYRPARMGSLSFEPLLNEELALIVGPMHPFFNRRRIRMIELHARLLVIPPAAFATRRLIDESMASAGAQPVVCFETGSIPSMLAAVEGSTMATILSRYALPRHTPLRAVALEGPTPVRTPGLVWNRAKPRNAIETLFAAILRETAGPMLATPRRRADRAA